MKIICIKEFKDKTTAEIKKDQKLIKVNEILECDDELAKERIKKGFAKKYVEPTTKKKEDKKEEK